VSEPKEVRRRSKYVPRVNVEDLSKRSLAHKDEASNFWSKRKRSVVKIYDSRNAQRRRPVMKMFGVRFERSHNFNALLPDQRLR
jgi:hypothetical protein